MLYGSPYSELIIVYVMTACLNPSGLHLHSAWYTKCTTHLFASSLRSVSYKCHTAACPTVRAACCEAMRHSQRRGFLRSTTSAGSFTILGAAEAGRVPFRIPATVRGSSWGGSILTATLLPCSTLANTTQQTSTKLLTNPVMYHAPEHDLSNTTLQVRCLPTLTVTHATGIVTCHAINRASRSMRTAHC